MDLNNKYGWRDIEGWFNFSQVYDYIIREAGQNDRIVEVGAWLGKSTCYLASRVKLSGKSLQVIAVDTFKGSPDDDYATEAAAKGNLLERFAENMTKAGVIDRILTMPMESTVAAHNIRDESVFAVYIDASHQYEDVVADITAWYPKIKPGGIIAGHDLAMPAVARGVKKGLEQFGVEYSEWECDDGWPSWYARKPLTAGQ